MAIFRCTKCGHLREVANDYIGRAVTCPRCQQTNQIHETVGFIQKIIDRYMAQYNELQHLRQQLAALEATQASLSDFSDDELDHLRQQLADADTDDGDSNGHNPLADIDIYNTTAIADVQQYQPVLDWFQQRGIEVDVNHQALDTTGFFDEVALRLGEHYDTLSEIIDKIKYIQQKGYTNVKLNLSKKSQKHIGTMTRFCHDLYNYSFLARKPYYNKQDKILRLTLQTAPPIVNFFNGEWLEWLVFMKLLDFFRERETPIACLRSLTIRFPNEDQHELDVFFLIDNRIPVCIECKSGEFRQQIEKYSTLRKRLKLEKSQFLLCVMGLDDTQIQGLSSMYDLTFTNERSVLEAVEGLLA